MSRAPAPEKPVDPLAVNYAAEVAEELSKLLGRKVRLVEGAKGGKIELEYYDADDRENLIDALRTWKKEG